MSMNFKTDRSRSGRQASTADLRGDATRRLGNIRAILVEKKIANTDQILGARKATRELVPTSFGMIYSDSQPEGVLQ